jgi:hypothetical protein
LDIAQAAMTLIIRPQLLRPQLLKFSDHAGDFYRLAEGCWFKVDLL